MEMKEWGKSINKSVQLFIYFYLLTQMEIPKCSFLIFLIFTFKKKLWSVIALLNRNSCNYVIMGLLNINRMSNLKSQNKFSNFIFFVDQTCSIWTHPMDLNTQHNQIHVFCNKLSMVLIETRIQLMLIWNEYSNWYVLLYKIIMSTI